MIDNFCWISIATYNMLTIKNTTIKNFLSVGQITQTIDFNRRDLTLILGENLDLGGDGARNGTGKTVIIQALSYALFGEPINKIKQDNLINRTNGKNMVVTVDFEVRGVAYRIVRGRKPNVLKFFINEQEQKSSDDSQGDSRETQDAIERVIGMTADMFRQIIALNTYNEPFLGMKVSDQRVIIEQLLGITLLSEKAEAIKELNKKTKEAIRDEEYRIKGVETANERITEQVNNLKKRQRLWQAKHDEDLVKLVAEYDELSKVDIESELRAHRELAEYVSKLERLKQYEALLARQTSWREKIAQSINRLTKELADISHVDIQQELIAHEQLASYNQLLTNSGVYQENLRRARDDESKLSKQCDKLRSEIDKLKENKCYACGQEFHDENHSVVLSNKQQQLQEVTEQYQSVLTLLTDLKNNPVVVPEKPKTYYKTHAEALQHNNTIANIQQRIEDLKNEQDPYQEQLVENTVVISGSRPETHYDTEEQAIKHSGRLESLLEQITNKHEEQDPYCEQIHDMESKAIVAVNYDDLNRLNKILQHQDYLLDLLTNKKSFVRKRIIEQNLGYLNSRLTHYLDKVGLPHQVVFQNDLSVEITELGRDLDFHNLSRGEMNRVIIALSFAFRDVWENLYSSCNLLFIDELIDSGMDTIGTENSLALLKDMVRRRGKSIWLVSHKDELTGRVDSILKVVKESGFTSYEMNETVA